MPAFAHKSVLAAPLVALLGALLLAIFFAPAYAGGIDDPIKRKDNKRAEQTDTRPSSADGQRKSRRNNRDRNAEQKNQSPRRDFNDVQDSRERSHDPDRDNDPNRVNDPEQEDRREIENTDNSDTPSPRTSSKPTKDETREIRENNKAGRSVGNIKIFVQKGNWGFPVKIQACFGDNILTKFSVQNDREMQGLRFQYKNATKRNRRRRRHKWVNVEPDALIRGRHIFLRAQSTSRSRIVQLQVRGICIDSPQR